MSWWVEVALCVIAFKEILKNHWIKLTNYFDFEGDIWKWDFPVASSFMEWRRASIHPRPVPKGLLCPHFVIGNQRIVERLNNVFAVISISWQLGYAKTVKNKSWVIAHMYNSKHENKL